MITDIVGKGKFSKFLVSKRFETNVVIKEIPNVNILIHRNEMALANLKHPHVLKFYSFQQDEHFK